MSNSFSSVTSQYNELNDLYEEHYAELLELEVEVQEEVRRSVVENPRRKLGRDTAEWVYHSLDFRKLIRQR